MSRNRRLPRQSQPIPNNLSPDLRKVMESFKEQLDVGGGLSRGNIKDRWLRFSDLEDAGLGRFNAALNGGQGGLEPPGSGGGNIVRPSVPQNFEVSGGYDWIHLRWDPNHNWPLVEIWRASDSDNISDAVLVGTVGNFGNQYPDHDVDYGVTYYYWVRFVNEAGIPQPFTPPNGVPGAIVLHPPELLQQLEDRITSTQLSQDLNDYVEGIEIKADHANNQYTIKIGQDGAIAGFGLGFTDPEYNENNPNHSIALFNVDTFAITHPGETDEDQRLVFAVEDGNVVMDAAYITNLVVTDAVIESINANKIIGETAEFVESNIINGSITSAKIALQIESGNYTGSGEFDTGWAINKNGYAVFQDIYARGDIEATTIKADAVNIVDTLNVNGNAITAPYYKGGPTDYSTGSSSWYTMITSSTIPTKTGMSGVLIWAVTQTTSINDFPWAEIRVVRNGSSAISGAIGASFGDGSTGSQVLTVFDSSPGTNPTYSLQCRSVAGNNRFRVPRMVIQASYR